MPRRMRGARGRIRGTGTGPGTKQTGWEVTYGTGGFKWDLGGLPGQPDLGQFPWGGSFDQAVNGLNSITVENLQGWGCAILTFLGFECTMEGVAEGIATYFVGNGTTQPPPGECPTGYIWDPDAGVCKTVGVEGWIEGALPGGQTGTMADVWGEAVVGAFGIPALVPAVRGQIEKADGSVGPILKCPRGAILGKDSLCYMKGSIPVKFRKWRPDPKPPMSAMDAKALRRIGTLQKKVKGLASTAGFSCRKK